ncbi:MAG: hypothetical protein O7G86_12820 [Gammaproteobacteria bacterium]|nr:hypothetical protein [Gammaproteobacteria bacterium]
MTNVLISQTFIMAHLHVVNEQRRADFWNAWGRIRVWHPADDPYEASKQPGLDTTTVQHEV